MDSNLGVIKSGTMYVCTQLLKKIELESLRLLRLKRSLNLLQSLSAQDVLAQFFGSYDRTNIAHTNCVSNGDQIKNHLEMKLIFLCYSYS